MSRETFNDNCPGCKPVILDPTTLKPFPYLSREMVAVRKAWETTTLEERAAFHDFTCLNSRDPNVLKLVEAINHKIEKALSGKHE
jgi:hypothetical protein